jgi:hypothetical protein
MSVEQGVVRRLNQLLDESKGLRRTNEHGQATSEEHLGQCVGWIAAALNVVQIACGSSESAYWKKAQTIEEASRRYGYVIPRAVSELASLLVQLLGDMEAGLLGSIADRARAETFDNFLDHGKAYLKDGRIKEAGVIAGVVFEDVLRRVCRKHQIEEKDVKLDHLISSLTKIGVLSEVKAKRARVAANVRTKATHAQWDEFTASDVEATINFTDEIVSPQLDA